MRSYKITEKVELINNKRILSQIDDILCQLKFTDSHCLPEHDFGWWEGKK